MNGFRQVAVRSIFGACLSTTLLLAAGSASARNGFFRAVYSFCSRAHCADGSEPEAPVVADKAGNLYGTTFVGGNAGPECHHTVGFPHGHGCGVVFRLAADGHESVLYAFAGGTDGSNPAAGLLFDAKGNLYGTTAYGGGGGCHGGCGTAFRLAPDSTEKVLHAFAGGTDGSYPRARLIADGHGDLYGTTALGGHGGCGGGCGTVFEIAPDGTETVLHTFRRDGRDGAEPNGGLLADNLGNLYGATRYGGGRQDCGVIFKLAPDGSATKLHSFAGADGCGPNGDLIEDKSSTLYGTTSTGGGTKCGEGVVFKLAPDGKETVLHCFFGKNGNRPAAGVIEDSQGYLYGTTNAGGDLACYPIGCGVVYRVAPDGKSKLLFAGGGSNGAYLLAGVTDVGNGTLYSTAAEGGAQDAGTVFTVFR